jgi:hypothetical protein
VQRVKLNIPASGYAAGDSFQAFVNADAAGRVLDAIDYTRPITGTEPVQFFPLGSAVDNSLIRTIESLRLYFGTYEFAIRTRDSVGNVTNAAATFSVFVNSGPRPVSHLKHSSTSGGRPVFTFTPPGQMG